MVRRLVASWHLRGGGVAGEHTSAGVQGIAELSTSQTGKHGSAMAARPASPLPTACLYVASVAQPARSSGGLLRAGGGGGGVAEAVGTPSIAHLLPPRSSPHRHPTSSPPAEDGHVAGGAQQLQVAAAREAHRKQRRRALQCERVAGAAAAPAGRDGAAATAAGPLELEGVGDVQGGGALAPGGGGRCKRTAGSPGLGRELYVRMGSSLLRAS
jgi:hypothetical protein